MRRFFHALAISTLLLAPAATASAQISFGIHIGEPPAPRAYRVPRQPGPDYVWIEGYWYPQGSRYTWHNGYWTRPPYQDSYWVEPYYGDGQYIPGQWRGQRGDLGHDHRWDAGKRRDERREPDRNDRDDRNDGNNRRR